jgi:hypothetical protein
LFEELDVENIPSENFVFHISSKLLKFLEPLKNEYKIAKLLYELDIKTQIEYFKRNGVPKNILVQDPIDYLDIDNEGNISFLKSRYFSEENKWENSRRVKTKITRILKEIYNQDFLREQIKETDVEAISIKMSTLKNTEAFVEEYRGMEILRAFNYKNELNELNFGQSCANFHQGSGNFGGFTEPKVSEFEIYTKNPEQCGVVVVWENGKIQGRLTFQQGIQVCDSVDYKKGEHHTVWGNYYGVGGKYNVMLTDYIKKKWPNATMKSSGRNGSGMCISLETRFIYYCPFDTMYVDFQHNLLTDSYRYLKEPYNSYKWVNTYHAFCPKELVLERMKEEKNFNTHLITKEPNFFQDTRNPKMPYRRTLNEKEIEILNEFFPHYTWANGIDADGYLIMNKRTTMKPKNESGRHYFTEKELESFINSEKTEDDLPNTF